MALSTSEIQMLEQMVSKMDTADLRILADLHNTAQRRITLNQALAFRVGDKVKWFSKYGRTIEGTVTKVNNKTIKVVTISDGQWSVSPSMLTKI